LPVVGNEVGERHARQLKRPWPTGAGQRMQVGDCGLVCAGRFWGQWVLRDVGPRPL